ACAEHFLRIAELMAVRRPAKRDKDGGAARSGDFRGGDGSCAANNNVCPGKALRHVCEEGDNFCFDFAPRISRAYSVVIALAGLMNNGQFALARREAVHGVDKCSVDWQRPLASAGDEQRSEEHTS